MSFAVDNYVIEMKNPLVSLITITYNAEKHLEQSILSVLNQTYSNIEYIIIDGGSADGTVDIIKNYENKIAYWVTEPDKGIYDAWNKGINASKGEWIAFVNADDWFFPDAVSSYMTYIQNNIGLELEYVSSVMEYTDDNLKRLCVFGNKWDWNVSLRYMNVAHPGSFHRRKLFEKYGLFDTKFKSSGDYELLFRTGKNLKAGFLEKITIKMRKGGISDGLIALVEKKMILEESGLFPKWKVNLMYCWDVLKKRSKTLLEKRGIFIYTLNRKNFQ